MHVCKENMSKGELKIFETYCGDILLEACIVKMGSESNWVCVSISNDFIVHDLRKNLKIKEGKKNY